MFNYKDKVGTIVAGSVVESGALRAGALERGSTYFRLKRASNNGDISIIADNQYNAQLKRFKETVHEVCIQKLLIKLQDWY